MMEYKIELEIDETFFDNLFDNKKFENDYDRKQGGKRAAIVAFSAFIAAFKASNDFYVEGSESAFIHELKECPDYLELMESLCKRARAK